MAPMSILIADNSVVVRRALRDLLSQDPERRSVCDEAGVGREALKKTTIHTPDVILLDLSMSELHGLVSRIWIDLLSLFGYLKN